MITLTGILQIFVSITGRILTAAPPPFITPATVDMHAFHGVTSYVTALGKAAFKRGREVRPLRAFTLLLPQLHRNASIRLGIRSGGALSSEGRGDNAGRHSILGSTAGNAAPTALTCRTGVREFDLEAYLDIVFHITCLTIL